MRMAGFALLVVLALAVAAYALAAYSFLPLGAALDADMRANFAAHRIAIYTHIFAALLALAIGPLQFLSVLRERHLNMHRWAGRLYLGVGVLVGGIAGLYMSMYAAGGPLARAGFAFLAILWLFTGYRAWCAARAGNICAHRRWMLRDFSLTFAAVTLRLWLPVALLLGVPFSLAYPAIAWLSWVPNLLFAEIFFARRNLRMPRKISNT